MSRISPSWVLAVALSGALVAGWATWRLHAMAQARDAVLQPAREALADGQAEVVVLGNSLARHGLDGDVLSEEVGAPVALVTADGSGPATWIALLRRALPEGAHPRTVVLASTVRDMLLGTRPTDAHARQLASLLTEDDADLAAFVGVSPDPLGTRALRERLLHDLAAPGVALLASDAPDQPFEDGVTADPARPLPAVADSLLPVVQASLAAKDIRMVIAWMPVSAGRSARAYPRPAREAVEAWAAAEGVAVVDLRDAATSPEDFRDTVHLSPDGRARVSHALGDVLAGRTQPAPPRGTLRELHGVDGSWPDLPVIDWRPLMGRWASHDAPDLPILEGRGAGAALDLPSPWQLVLEDGVTPLPYATLVVGSHGAWRIADHDLKQPPALRWTDTPDALARAGWLPPGTTWPLAPDASRRRVTYELVAMSDRPDAPLPTLSPATEAPRRLGLRLRWTTVVGDEAPRLSNPEDGVWYAITTIIDDRGVVYLGHPHAPRTLDLAPPRRSAAKVLGDENFRDVPVRAGNTGEVAVRNPLVDEIVAAMLREDIPRACLPVVLLDAHAEEVPLGFKPAMIAWKPMNGGIRAGPVADISAARITTAPADGCTQGRWVAPGRVLQLRVTRPHPWHAGIGRLDVHAVSTSGHGTARAWVLADDDGSEPPWRLPSGQPVAHVLDLETPASLTVAIEVPRDAGWWWIDTIAVRERSW